MEKRRNKTQIKSQKVRLLFVEAMLLTTEQVSRKDLMDRFGISKAAASKDILAYRDMCPDEIAYSTHRKCWVSMNLKQHLFEDTIFYTPEEYLKALDHLASFLFVFQVLED